MTVEITDKSGAVVIDRSAKGQEKRVYPCGSIVDKEEHEATKKAWVESGIAKVAESRPKEK